MNRNLIMTLSVLLLGALVGCGGDEFGGPEPIQDGLVGNVFLLPETTLGLPDFNQLAPEGTLYTTKLDIPDRDFVSGFPGITDRFEWFGLQYEGVVQVKTPGSYTFGLNSDDGSKLYIGSQLIINNDGIHDVRFKSGQVFLEAGDHPLTVEYFQGPKRRIALQLFITPPGQASQIFDSTVAY